MELLLSIMCFVLYILSRLMIWHEVGENKSKKQGNVFSPSMKLDIRYWPKASKHV